MHTYTYMPEGSELWALMPAGRPGEPRQQGLHINPLPAEMMGP